MKLQLVYLPFDGLRLAMKVAAARALMSNPNSWALHREWSLSSSFFDALKLRKADAVAVNQVESFNEGDLVLVPENDKGVRYQGRVLSVRHSLGSVLVKVEVHKFHFTYHACDLERVVIEPVAVNQVESPLCAQCAHHPDALALADDICNLESCLLLIEQPKPLNSGFRGGKTYSVISKLKIRSAPYNPSLFQSVFFSRSAYEHQQVVRSVQ